MKVPKANKLPSGSWNIRLRLGGEEISVTEPSEQEAIKKARLIKAEYLAGKREAKVAESSLTLSAAIDLYCADRSNKLSPATVRKYKNIKTNHWKSLMQKRMDEITARQWQAAVNEMLARYATKTVKVSLGMTKSVVLACGAKFPKVKIKKSSAEKAKEIDKCKFLEPEQILEFVNTVEKKYAETPYAIPLLLALSSLRIGEIDGLDWENVTDNIVKIRRVRIMDENNEWIYKDGAKTEGSVRDVPVFIPQLAALLKANRKAEGKVMLCCQDALRRACGRVCKDAGVPCPGVHGLRHSFASLCASPQVSIPELISQQIGGWENDKIMKEIYTHVAKSDINASLSRLTAFYKNEKKTPTEGEMGDQNADKNDDGAETL